MLFRGLIDAWSVWLQISLRLFARRAGLSQLPTRPSLSNIADSGIGIHFKLPVALSQEILNSSEILFADGDVLLEFRSVNDINWWFAQR